MVHFSILPATPARQGSPGRGQLELCNGAGWHFPAARLREQGWCGSVNMDSCSFQLTEQGQGKKDPAHEFPHEWLWKKGKSGMKNRLRGCCDSPHSLSLWSSLIFTFTKSFNKNASILIANNLIVLLIWRMYLPLIHLKKEGKKIFPQTWKLLILLTDLRWICQVCIHFFKN